MDRRHTISRLIAILSELYQAERSENPEILVQDMILQVENRLLEILMDNSNENQAIDSEHNSSQDETSSSDSGSSEDSENSSDSRDSQSDTSNYSSENQSSLSDNSYDYPTDSDSN